MPHPTYTHVVDVYRLTRTGNAEAYSGTPAITGLDVSVVPAAPETVAIYGGMNAFALFEIYTGENVTLRQGDKLVSGSRAWIVKGAPQQIDNRYLSFTRVIGQEEAA